MYIVYSPNHTMHNPPFEISNGTQIPHYDKPKRLEVILTSLKRNGFQIEGFSKKAPISLIKRIHDLDYITFLKKMCNQISAEKYLYPSVFSSRSFRQVENSLAKLGIYSSDMYTPLSSKTYQCALDSAAVAYEVAVQIQRNNTSAGYALCRPPGHHAERNQMRGYCYLNNCAIAVEFLSSFGKVATLDIDFHHGNGTQQIFYARKDVLTTSIHGDPSLIFPYFSGFSDEIGLEEGRGFNINVPLSKGIKDRQYQKELEKILSRIQDFSPSYLVVGLGFDTHEDDPIGGFALTTNYYSRMAKTIAALNIPTVIIQEGGYNIKTIGRNVLAFLKGFAAN